MEVPDWLMKPTENNKEHIKLLAMIEHVQKAAERREVDSFLNKQVEKLNTTFWEHAKNTVDLDDNPVVEALEKDRKKTLIVGLALAASIFVPYGLLTRTNLLHPRSRDCWELASAQEQKNTKVCLIAIDHPYNPSNGDVSLALSLEEAQGKQTVINADFWIADEIGNRQVDYRGEFNINRTRVYNHGLLVNDDNNAWSSWVKPMIPEDSVYPLWDKIKSKEREFTYSRPLPEDVIVKFVENAGALIAGIGSILFTAWKFYSKS
jgi:hypothetical protein